LSASWKPGIQIFAINRGELVADTTPLTPPPPPNVFSNRVTKSGSASIHATVILLDGINDYFDNYARSRAQVISLIGRLRPDERVAIYVLSLYQGLIVLQDYTTDHDLLVRNLSAYLPSGMIPAPPGMAALPAPPRSERDFFMRNGAESARTAIQAIANHMAIVPGRKTLLWLSQGFPPRQIRESSDSWAKTIDVMNQANVELDAVDSNGLAGPPRRWGPGGLAGLQELPRAPAERPTTIATTWTWPWPRPSKTTAPTTPSLSTSTTTSATAGFIASLFTSTGPTSISTTGRRISLVPTAGWSRPRRRRNWSQPC
jgi:VWFA-related protein